MPLARLMELIFWYNVLLARSLVYLKAYIMSPIFSATRGPLMSKIHGPVLSKALTSIDVFATGFGAVIGWGWIVLLGAYLSFGCANDRSRLLSSSRVDVVHRHRLSLRRAYFYDAYGRGEQAFALRAFGPKLCCVTGWFTAQPT